MAGYWLATHPVSSEQTSSRARLQTWKTAVITAEDKPWVGQGIRFGLAVAFVSCVPTYIIYYVVQPMPEMLVVKQVAFDLVRTIGLGACVAWLYR